MMELGLTHCEVRVPPVCHYAPLVIVLHLSKGASFSIFSNDFSFSKSLALELILLLLNTKVKLGQFRCLTLLRGQCEVFY
jgi:hypothetical protein